MKLKKICLFFKKRQIKKMFVFLFKKITKQKKNGFILKSLLFIFNKKIKRIVKKNRIIKKLKLKKF